MESTFIAEKPIGYQQLVVDATTAQALTVPAGTLLMLVCPSAAIRFRDDGADPTALIGYPVVANGELRYTSRSPTVAKFISQSGNATLDVLFYGQ